MIFFGLRNLASKLNSREKCALTVKTVSSLGDSPAHLDKRSEQRHVSSTYTNLKRFTVLFVCCCFFETNSAACFVCYPTRRTRCLYAGADWLSSYVSQRVGRGQFLCQGGQFSISPPPPPPSSSMGILGSGSPASAPRGK